MLKQEKYTYDEQGLRIKKEEFLGSNKKSTYYVYSGNDILFTETYINDKPIDMKFNIADMVSFTYHYGQDAREELNYYYKDHRQNRVVKTEADGSIISSANKFGYSSWGELDNPDATEESWFTGKKQDESGLYYFNARYYDSEMGRFLQEDPARQGDGWYTYCNNDPLNTYDPDGKDPPAKEYVPGSVPVYKLEGEQFQREVDRLWAIRCEEIRTGSPGIWDKKTLWTIENFNRGAQEQGKMDLVANIWTMVTIGAQVGAARGGASSAMDSIRYAIRTQSAGYPLGFRSLEEFDKAVKELKVVLEKEFGKDYKIIISGSSISGWSSTGVRYDAAGKGASDIDIAVVAKGKLFSLPTSPKIIGMIKEVDMYKSFPGIFEWVKRWGFETNKKDVGSPPEFIGILERGTGVAGFTSEKGLTDRTYIEP